MWLDIYIYIILASGGMSQVGLVPMPVIEYSMGRFSPGTLEHDVGKYSPGALATLLTSRPFPLVSYLMQLTLFIILIVI